MNKSKIEWTDRTWNPVTGCTKVSQGCKYCYAERIFERFNGHGSFKKVVCHQDRLAMPLSWKKPSMVFVNSMSDLFHEDVPFEFIDAVFRVMNDVDHHIYQVLTKRPKRMLEFYQWKQQEFGIPWQAKDNVWIGVSVEDQKTASERIPMLCEIPTAVRFLSCEPLLGNLNLNHIFKICKHWNARTGNSESYGMYELKPQALVLAGWKNPIHWVICGGESGPQARPMHPDWARSLRDQCEVAGVPFFFKQWGEYADGSDYTSTSKHICVLTTGEKAEWGKYPIAYPQPNCQAWKDLHPTVMRKVGKKISGRLLDGVEHNGMPKIVTEL